MSNDVALSGSEDTRLSTEAALYEQIKKLCARIATLEALLTETRLNYRLDDKLRARIDAALKKL